jgi:hypothetical protein
MAGLLAYDWLTFDDATEDARKGTNFEVEAPAATSGTEPRPETFTGAPSGPSGEGDTNYFQLPQALKKNQSLARLGRQALYVVSTEPLTIPNADMVAEGRTDQEDGQSGYYVYVPREESGGDKASARYYYLKVGENKYLKVSLEPQS